MTAKVLILAASLVGTAFVWWRLLHFKEHPALKVVLAVVALFPVIGPLMGLWIVGMPDKAPMDLRATMNHRGRGGRFIGFGSGKFSYDDFSEEGKDWNPTVPELMKEKQRRTSDKND